MPLQIIPRNLTDDATLSVTPAAVSGLDADNLQLSDRGLVLRVLGDAATITATLPQLRRIGGVVLWRHLLSVVATWRVRLYDGPDGTGAVLFDSTDLPALPSKTLGDLDWGIDTLGAALSSVDFSSITFDRVIARSLVIDIADTGAALVQVGRLFAGAPISLTHSIDWDSSLQWDSTTKRSRTAGGGLRVEAEGVYRRMKFAHEWINPEERSLIADLLRDAGNRAEVWISQRADEGGQFEVDHALVGYLTQNAELTRRQGVRYATQFEIEES
jgi:hypothetical protein